MNESSLWDPGPDVLALAEDEKPFAPTPAARPAVRHSEVGLKAQQEERQKERERRDQEAEAKRAASGVAFAGKIVDVTNAPEVTFPEFPKAGGLESWVPGADQVDFSDLAAINQQILYSRRRLYAANNELREAQRRKVEAEFEYRRAHNRIMAGLTGGSEKQRSAIADVRTEELWAAYLLASQIADEYLALVRAVRTDLDALQGLSHNVRAQIQMM